MAVDWAKFARIIGAGLASICTFLFGKPDIWLMTLLAFIVIDYISGVIGAYINHELIAIQKKYKAVDKGGKIEA